EVGVVALRHVLAHRLRDVVRHRERAAQNLERVQPETVALVLHEELLKPKVLRHPVQLRQRRLRILRTALVERPRLLHVLQAHHRQTSIRRLRHSVRYPFYLVHLQCPPYQSYISQGKRAATASMTSATSPGTLVSAAPSSYS